MKNNLKEETVLTAISYFRQVPIAWQNDVQNQLNEMLQHGIIRGLKEESSKWCHPMVIVPKNKGGVRICVDLTGLNRYVKRLVYPTQTPKEAISKINSSARFFTTMDAKHGYWQISLEEESQKLTTFITPWGRYCFLRAPMGLSSTGDEYCRRGDIAISGLNNIQKVIDDSILYDENFEDHVSNVRAFLTECRENHITLNKEKFKFAEEEVDFVGYKITKNGVSADPSKVEAISNFPPPTNIT